MFLKKKQCFLKCYFNFFILFLPSFRQNEWTRTRMVMDNYSDVVQTSSVDWLPTPGSPEQGTSNILNFSIIIYSFRLLQVQ